MTERRHPHTRSNAARRLKLIFLILFCACIVALVFQRATNAEHFEKSPQLTSSFSEERAAENQPPELSPVRFKEVGVGQHISFGLDVIDEESDDVRVELVQKPASARYNDKTLTVEWTPRPTDGQNGNFVVRLTELASDTGQPARSRTQEFNIAIRPRPVHLPEVPPSSLEVETLISITDKARLAAANARWPITALFDRIAEIEASKQIKPGDQTQPTKGASLFYDVLRNLAALHRNDEINPDSLKFNFKWESENWRLIMVRPRVNKKIFELRLVYRNMAAPEPVYLMPRMRIVRGTDADIGKDNALRLKNNETFARLLHQAFFDGQNLKPFVANDKKKYGEALADFISQVVNYHDDKDPRMQANFAALPHNARLGGDDTLDAEGNYLKGNGWALGVMKVVPVEKNGKRKLGFANLPIDGFAASIKPTPDGKNYRPVAAPHFDPKSPLRIPGLDTLVDQLGFTAIPDERNETAVKPSIIDASSISRAFKDRYLVEETSLRDPRRRLFEERGMTCIQCHVRNFDEGDYLNKAVRDPQQSDRIGTARDIPRLFFVLTPDEERSEFFRRSEEEQVGNFIGVMRDFLNIKVNLKSPFGVEWPFDTRLGRG